MSDVIPTYISPASVRRRIIEENMAMLKYLSSEGKALPKLAEKVIECNNETIKELGLSSNEILLLHKQLADKIQPAKPKTILLLYKESGKGMWNSILGPVRLVRRLMTTTLISLVIFIGVGLSSFVNEDSLSKGILANYGYDLLFNLVFILSAAALGGCFSALFQLSKYINNGTYDPKYESSYWIKLLLGLISGLMMAVIIPVSSDLQIAEGKSTHLTIPLLAMLGGFSATLAFRILTRIVWAVESLFVGKKEDMNEQKLLNIKILHEHEMSVEQEVFKQKLIKIKSDLMSNKSHKEIQESIEEILKNTAE